MVDNKRQEMRAVTISRQYGSGGGEIAARLAHRLNWQLVDHAIVVQAAEETGLSEREAVALDERTDRGIARAFRKLAALPLVSGTDPGAGRLNKLGDDDYQGALRNIIEAAAESGQVVIVGRASQAELAKWRDVLHVRIVAPYQSRVAYVVQREGLDEAKAQARINEKDRNRARFLETVYHRQVNDPELYDLVINTGCISLDGAVTLIRQALEDKAQTLGRPEEELGPAQNLGQYSGQPADLRSTTTLK